MCRDINCLESAIYRPLNFAHWEHADIALQAAALAHGIAKDHCFFDGNKRTAHICCWTFLRQNGYTMDVRSEGFAEWIEEAAQDLDVYELAERIRMVPIAIGD